MENFPIMSLSSPPRVRENNTSGRHSKQVPHLARFMLLGFLGCDHLVFAQSDASEHASHHPSGAAQAPKSPSLASPDSTVNTGQASGNNLPKPPPSAPSGAVGMKGATGMPPDDMGAMGQMMQKMMSPASEGCCGGGTRAEIYPFLMSLPSLTSEQRAQVQRLAAERIGEGEVLIQRGHQRLSAATASGDHNLAADAIEQVRDGLGRIGSGMSVHKMLQEATPPRVVATRWFKSEMNIDSAETAGTGSALHGITPIHLLTMLLLVAFAVAMILMYFFKMRRTVALFGRIESGAGKPPPGAAPVFSGTPPPPPNPPTPAAPTAGAVPGMSAKSSGSRMTRENDHVSSSSSEPEERPEQALPPTGPVALGLAKDTLPSIPDAKWRGHLRVVEIVTETPNVKTVRLGPPAGQASLPFTFLPGQFLNVAFSIGGARMNRSYSISSSPTQRDHLDLTVKREPRGAVSRHIDDLLRVGDEIEAGGPVGRFTFDGTEANSIVLISGGVGITPMMSISRYLTQKSWPNEIFFIYACRSPADFIFANDLAELECLNVRLHVTVVMEHPEGTDWKGPTGRLSKDLLAQAVPDITLRRIHICGPPVMMEAVRALLAELKVPSDQVKTEDFGTAAPVPSLGGTVKFGAPATGPLVNFSKNNRSAKIHIGQTVLELSEELNIGIEFSCRVGTCGICKVKLTAGEVDMAIDDALDADDKAQGVILACQAKPKGPITVEA